jgi:hypothetical protein
MVVITAPPFLMEWDGDILIPAGDGIMAGATRITADITAGVIPIIMEDIAHGTIHITITAAIATGIMNITSRIRHTTIIMEADNRCTEQTWVQEHPIQGIRLCLKAMYPAVIQEAA